MAGLLALPLLLIAQNERDEVPMIDVSNGLSFTKDSVFMLNLRFRIQNRAGFTTVSGDDLTAETVDLRVRRLRLRLDGYMLSTKLRYYVQLNFSRADLDLESDVVAQPLRDALVYYFFSDRFYAGFGQGKLPGNRQRVTSSGNQQFPDRSIANSAFTLDRDVGLFLYGMVPFGSQWLNFKGAITSGDGRNALVGSNGLCYTGRVEWLPLGAFRNNGDYSEGDLELEPRPRLSVAAGYAFNNLAVRTGGQLGQALYAPRDIGTFIADFVLKHKGWALSAEYFDRRCDDPLTFGIDEALRYVTTGQGLNAQLSRYFGKGYEIASRYTLVEPSGEVSGLRDRTEEALLGASKYMHGHRVKLQWYAGYRWTGSEMEFTHPGNSWTTMFQIEFGI